MEMADGKGELMNELPKEPVMLLSYINTQLRDFYPSLEEFCAAADVSLEEITEILGRISYTYNRDRNQFT